jgi:hypothetical protein
MADVTTTAEDERTISEMYDKHQALLQQAHDIARDQIVNEYGVSEEEAEGMPELEGRFNIIREELAVAQNPNGQVLSVHPDTGEPGPPAPRSAPARPPLRSGGAAPQYAPTATSAAYAPPAALGVDRRQAAEQLLAQSGFQVAQSHVDYVEGIITLVIR